jgi:succinyl-CoA synthetase alpha subunit
VTHHFVPPAFAADAIRLLNAGIEVIITITQGNSVADMVGAAGYIKDKIVDS